MIDKRAFEKVTYGIYLVCSGTADNPVGYIANTAFQVSSEPPMFAIACSKNNNTTQIISDTGYFSFAVLREETPAAYLGRFGYRSGRDFDKFSGLETEYCSSGVPVLTGEALAWFECRVEKSVDAGTHILFLGTVISSGVTETEGIPMTYRYYRENKKLLAPKNAPTFIRND